MQIKLKNVLVMLPIMLTLIGTITGIMTYVNISVEQDFAKAWLASFTFAFIVMLPAGGLVFAAMNELVNQFFAEWSNVQRKLIQGVLAAVVMESIMAIVTTFTHHDQLALRQFMSLFINSFLYALPVGITFACTMTLVLHPRLERFLTESSACKEPSANNKPSANKSPLAQKIFE
ncbi:DUF2798 domain-containing protein [Paraglaciecola aquimarina]|uniref:DUF2798 domain-containing protein n=1 Tax=Paraglaciecola aquimarina TaxID=1235557 RepID=A0ABU3T2K8_9ALTE|nr:DUF2798 domain-containing protein [Paraglaciecola aquimarina]MDU0356442.1 DUF2798 domain-containing protein [Paraglaciecola aquimarina]